MTRETKSQLMAARAHERARLLALIERWDDCHATWARIEREDREAHALSTAERAKIRKDIYAEVVLALRVALRLDSQPSAATPKEKP